MSIFDPIIVTALMLISPLSVIPQIIKATKDTRGLSIMFFLLQLVFQTYYTFYYLSINSTPLLINGIAAVVVYTIMVATIFIKRR